MTDKNEQDRWEPWLARAVGLMVIGICFALLGMVIEVTLGNRVPFWGPVGRLVSLVGVAAIAPLVIMACAAIPLNIIRELTSKIR